MRAYQSLLRLAKMEVDARSRALAEAVQEEALAASRIAEHDAMVDNERQEAQAEGDSLMAYGAFFQRAQMRRQNLSDQHKHAEHKVGEARQDLASAMTEQKRYERLIELAEERAVVEEAARERAFLDEAATLRHAQSGRSERG